MTTTPEMKIKALAPWFGSNRTLAAEVGKELAGYRWVGVPFAGGMSELAEIDAPTIVVSDLHREVINLARVVKDDDLRRELVRRMSRTPFHADVLDQAQEWCKVNVPGDIPDLVAAENYFVCCWMGRSHIAGISDQYHGRISIRWNANGGDSNTRFRNAYRSMSGFGKIFRRCNFSVLDAFEFYARAEDEEGHAIYGDPPFPKAGRIYKHNCGDTESQERDWHTRLRDAASRFKRTRIVMRFYDHPLIRELYPATEWTWRFLKGRTQANTEGAEVLLINGPSYVTEGSGLFS